METYDGKQSYLVCPIISLQNPSNTLSLFDFLTDLVTRRYHSFPLPIFMSERISTTTIDIHNLLIENILAPSSLLFPSPLSNSLTAPILRAGIFLRIKYYISTDNFKVQVSQDGFPNSKIVLKFALDIMTILGILIITLLNQRVSFV